MRTTVSALVLFLVCTSPLIAGKPRWTIDDIVNSETISDIQVSPDGRWAVWIHRLPSKERDELGGNLVRLDLRTGRETILTRGTDSCSRLRWSPDGKHLAFLSARSAVRRHASSSDDTRQIWLIDPSGGEAWPLSDWASGILLFDWAGPDALVFSAEEKPTFKAATRKEEKDDSAVVDDKRQTPVRLFRIDVSSKKVKRLTDNDDRIERLAVSPDGRHAVAMHQRSPRYVYDNKIKPAVMLYHLQSGKAQRIFAEPDWNIQNVVWSPDSAGFYAVNMHNSQPRLAQAGVLHLHYFDRSRQASLPVDLDWPRGLTDQEDIDETPRLAVTQAGFLALLADGVHHKLAAFKREGQSWRRTWITGEHAAHVSGIKASADGKTLLYSYSTASTPTQWYHTALADARLDKPRAFAVLNPRLRELPRARTEVVNWKGARGEEVEGLLYYPHDYREGTKHPLVVMIHGGPAAADFDAWEESWDYAANLVCQRGAFVLKPNYHGSTSYGLKWLESITHGRYGELETIDIEKGVDSLIARGLVDSARLALYGWSNGAILANRLTVQTNRYKAAIVGAGNVEYVSDWANCDFGDAFDRYYMGSTPLDNPLLFLVKSPFYRLDRVRTPTLIFFGDEDRTVPVQQGWMQYRALQQLGKTDVRFVLFPGEKHSLTKLAHQRRKLKEELAWLDRYLFAAETKSNPALKADSPLAWTLKRRQAHREGGRYGLLVKEHLIPETVTHGDLRIGRFEVTRAQFAAFDPTYKVEKGRENYPANGISFEQAKEYCAWLSKLTGRKYHLPNETEAEELYDSAHSEENTLDHWAGYAVNPDDAARLLATLKERDAETLLLTEVGSFRAVGDDQAVFDLGGNVAEWVTTRDGKGALRGGSADTPADSKQQANKAGAKYRGFRVIEESAR